MGEKEVKIDLSGLLGLMKALEPKEQRRFLRMAASVVARNIKERVRANKITPKSKRARSEGGKTLIDTGRLLKTVRVRMIRWNEAVVAAGNLVDVKYAAIHHFGGIIRGNLTIPVFRIKDSKRYRMNLRVADVIENKGTGPRGGKVLVARYPSEVAGARVFWGRSRKGNVLLFAKTKKGLIPLFVLKHQVVIPERKWFDVDKQTVAKLMKEWRNWLQKLKKPTKT